MFNVDDINMIPNNSLVRFRGMVCGQPLTVVDITANEGREYLDYLYYGFARKFYVDGG
jgi:hypothetical protein